MVRMPMPLVYASRNAAARKGSTLVTTVAVGVSVMVFLVMYATAEGISRLATGTGSPENLLVLAAGASNVELSYLDRETVFRARELPGIARDDAGTALASIELMLPRPVKTAEGTNGEIGRYVGVRGVTPVAFAVHDGVELVSGRYPSGDEVLVGELAAENLGGVRLGDRLWISARPYSVAGFFRAPGQAFAGEIWTDLDALRSATSVRGASTLVLRAPDVQGVDALVREVEGTPGLVVSVQPEPRYYENILVLAQPVVAVGNVLGVLLGIGAVLAGMNAMYAAMSRRVRELATLRALGFSRYYVGGTLLLESLVIAAVGGALGTALASAFDGAAIDLIGLSLELSLEPRSVAYGFGLALAIGAFGGMLPAISALRIQISEALRLV